VFLITDIISPVNTATRRATNPVMPSGNKDAKTKKRDRDEAEVISVSSSSEDESDRESSSEASSSSSGKEEADSGTSSASEERSPSNLPLVKKNKKQPTKEGSSSEAESSSSSSSLSEKENNNKPDGQDTSSSCSAKDEDASESEEEEDDSDFAKKRGPCKNQPAAKRSKTEGKEKLPPSPERLSDSLRMSRTAEIDPTGVRPPFFKLDLHPHQVEGVRFLDEKGSAALVYEMGLGKTSMVLAAICNHINKYRIEGNPKEANRSHLVVLPKSVKSSWTTDFEKFIDSKKGAVSIKCITEKPLKPEEIEDIKAGKYTIILVGYEKMRTDFMNIVRPLAILPKNFNFGKARSISMVLDSITEWESNNKGKRCPLQLNPNGTASEILTDHWLFGTTWGVLVLDEAHHIRNGASQVFLACCAIQAKRRFFVSGTPLQNKRDDVYNAFRFIRAESLMDLDAWTKAWPDVQASHLAQISKDLLKWKKKEDVGMQQVPMHIFHYKVGFDDEKEKEVYGAYQEFMGRIADRAMDCKNRRVASKSEGYIGAVHLFSAILAARQCCNAACIITPPEEMKQRFPEIKSNRDGWSGKRSTKMKALRSVVEKHVGPEEKFLLFSSMLEALDLSQSVLEELGIRCERLTGDMKDDARKKATDNFRSNPKVRCFLISLKAGGEGLNLKEAHRVIILDPWWNWQAMLQAMCRAHRIDSQHEVRVTIITVQDTVEDVMLQKAEEKRKMADDLYAASTVYELFAKADGANGNGGRGSGNGEGRGLNDLVRMVRDFQHSSQRAVGRGDRGEFDEEKEHEERELCKKEVMASIKGSGEKSKKRAHPSAPAEEQSSPAGAKRKSPDQDSSVAPTELAPVHVAPLFVKHFRSLIAGTCVWTVKFAEGVHGRYPLVRKSFSSSEIDHTQYDGWDTSRCSSSEVRASVGGMHISFLGIAEAMLKVMVKVREILISRGCVKEEYLDLKRGMKYAHQRDLLEKEASYKSDVATLPSRISDLGDTYARVARMFPVDVAARIRARTYTAPRLFETEGIAEPANGERVTNLLEDLRNVMLGYSAELSTKLAAATKELKVIGASRDLSPEQAKELRRTFKIQVARCIRDEVKPSVKEVQAIRDLDAKKGKDFNVEGGAGVGYEKITCTSAVKLKSFKDVSDSIELDPMDFVMYVMWGGYRSIYALNTNVTPYNSYQYSMKPEDLRPDKNECYDASTEFTVTSSSPYRVVPLCTCTYDRASELHEWAIRKGNGHLAALIMMALLLDPPGAKDGASRGRCMYRYAVLSDACDPDLIGVFAFYTYTTCRSLYRPASSDSSFDSQIVILGAEALDPKDQEEINKLCSARLIACLGQKVDATSAETVQDRLQHVLFPSRARNVFKMSLSGRYEFVKRKQLDERSVQAFEPLTCGDIAFAAGTVHERFIKRA
jgi:SNF2 family DNA or RNA helicase